MKKNIYKKTIVLIITFAVFGNLSVFSDDLIDANSQRIIPLDSPVYDYIDFLTQEAATVRLSDVKPFSEAEVLTIIDELDVDALSEAGKNGLQ